MTDILSILAVFFQVVFGFLLIVFIPGCAISFVFYPRISDISLVTRIVYSAVISVGITICAILFLDLFLGVDSTPVNSTIILIVFSLIACLIWGIRWFFWIRKENEKTLILAPRDL